jgi:hypothetical protein
MFGIRDAIPVSYFHAELVAEGLFLASCKAVRYCRVCHSYHRLSSETRVPSPGVRRGDHQVKSEPGPGSSLRSCYVELDLMFVEMDGARINMEAQTNVRPASLRQCTARAARHYCQVGTVEDLRTFTPHFDDGARMTSLHFTVLHGIPM